MVVREETRRVMVVKGGDQPFGQGRGPVIVVVGDQCSHGSQGRSPVMVVRGGDQLWWSGEETSYGGQGNTPAIVVRGEEETRN